MCAVLALINSLMAGGPDPHRAAGSLTAFLTGLLCVACAVITLPLSVPCLFFQRSRKLALAAIVEIVVSASILFVILSQLR